MILGGWDVYWSIMDFVTWMDTLYVFNVTYPINLEIVFQYA